MLKTLLLALLLSAPALARAAYYVTVFAYHDTMNLPENSHTFATFIEAEGEEILSKATISWLPRSLVVCPSCGAEPGINMDLVPSLELGVENLRYMYQWGPYEIKKELFDRAVHQAEHLSKGVFLYKCLDKDVRPKVGSNCMHAVSDIDMDNGMLNTGSSYGYRGSRLVLRHLRRWLVRPVMDHLWLNGKLGIAHFPMEHETYPRP